MTVEVVFVGVVVFGYAFVVTVENVPIVASAIAIVVEETTSSVDPHSHCL